MGIDGCLHEILKHSDGAGTPLQEKTQYEHGADGKGKEYLSGSPAMDGESGKEEKQGVNDDNFRDFDRNDRIRIGGRRRFCGGKCVICLEHRRRIARSQCGIKSETKK